jgi:predicted metallo-beta-lactamase superfamily hydrolase
MTIGHNLHRDPEWRMRIKEAQEKGAEKGSWIITAAEFVGQENLLL